MYYFQIFFSIFNPFFSIFSNIQDENSSTCPAPVREHLFGNISCYHNSVISTYFPEKISATGWPRSYRKYILLITQPSQYGYAKLQYRFAVTSWSPSTLALHTRVNFEGAWPEKGPQNLTIYKENLNVRKFSSECTPRTLFALFGFTCVKKIFLLHFFQRCSQIS